MKEGCVPDEPGMVLALLQPEIGVVRYSIVVARSIGAFPLSTGMQSCIGSFPLFDPRNNASEPHLCFSQS